MDTYWVPGVKHLGTHGRWAFVELTDLHLMDEQFSTDLSERMDAAFTRLLDKHLPPAPPAPTTPSEAHPA